MVTREEIVLAALRLVAARGMGSLSVRRVAAEAGVGATTLRHHFPTQAQLHLAVAERLVHGPVEDLSIADDERDPAERLSECLVQFAPADGRTPAVQGWFELQRMSAGADAVPGARVIVESARRSTAERLRRWLTVLAGRGHLAIEEVDGQVATALTLLDGLRVHALLSPGSGDRETAGRVLRWFAEQVVGARPAAYR
ncbi:TetR/AcrR family transcriptional regulator [Amycolatopsis jiangsuensis]|uniref:AcrR family transcriptional regulator n=1 Tax=Amycolatopsis jiangsuensis TaxID=1181879 RepID=A0A840J6M2_9PSEU|nr:TetR/AcrR family transcriptional regulator [Amycolatopsis jiangsuensis]MBB4689082.1 AcrR family transcriptional regulator [Amycolatopsis jiangsuensis]